MLLDRILLTGLDDHSCRLSASLHDATFLLSGDQCGRSPELTGRLRRVRADLAVLLVRAGRMPCCIASEQTAEAVLMEHLLAVAFERGGPEEMVDLIALAGDLAPRLLAAAACA